MIGFAIASMPISLARRKFRIVCSGSAAIASELATEVDRRRRGGLNFFLTPIVGMALASYIEDWKWPDHANGSLILRWPIQRAGIAPYIFGGGGRQWRDIIQWTKHAGAGLELRINRYTGIFADGRYIWPEETRDYVLFRSGLRLGF